MIEPEITTIKKYSQNKLRGRMEKTKIKSVSLRELINTTCLVLTTDRLKKNNKKSLSHP